ncbi:MAG TPA: hypothetical protein PLR37_08935 [Candidatus Accumulibacter phosphatis]|nr:hypothetical protein [Candidatus Accumulibacter phosphatis]
MTAKTISSDAMKRVIVNLGAASFALRAMHELAASYDNGVDGETLSTSVTIMAKDAGRTLDACLIELGDFALGFFDDDRTAKPMEACAD